MRKVELPGLFAVLSDVHGNLPALEAVIVDIESKGIVDVICLGDHATGDLVGPWTYHDYLPSYHREVTQRIGCPMVLHCCGNTLDRMDYICESGFDCFHFESKVDARDAVAKVDGRISLMGNLNNPETLLNGTADEVAEQTRYAVEAGVQVIGPECAIPLRTPLENLMAIATIAREA